MLKYFSSLLLLLLVFSTAEANKSSLWLRKPARERGLAADRVAHAVGDILTVSVNESTTQKNNVKTTNGKTVTLDNSVTDFLYSAMSLLQFNGTNINTNANAADTYEGKGTIDNNSTLTTKVSVTVIDVLPNGNLVIEGIRRTAFAKEREFAVLTGIVRPYDISNANEVASTKIADANVEFISEGELTTSANKGWVMKLHDLVNPF